jgi:hypothetical protein
MINGVNAIGCLVIAPLGLKVRRLAKGVLTAEHPRSACRSAQWPVGGPLSHDPSVAPKERFP